MGINTSNINNPDILYEEIQRTIKNLIYEYNVWSSEEMCNNLEIIYYDKLIKFDKSELLDASAAIGYSYNKNVQKGIICQQIIEHYRRRIKLLRDIKFITEKVRDRLYQAKNGPVCKNVDAHVEDFVTCSKIPQALWLDQYQYQKILENIKNDKRFEIWEYWIENLSCCYYQSLNKILNIIIKIKYDVNNSLTEMSFKELEEYTKNVLEDMDVLSEIYYILAINHP